MVTNYPSLRELLRLISKSHPLFSEKFIEILIAYMWKIAESVDLVFIATSQIYYAIIYVICVVTAV